MTDEQEPQIEFIAHSAGTAEVVFTATAWDASIIFLALHAQWSGEEGGIEMDGELRWSGKWGRRDGVVFTESLNPEAGPVDMP